MEDTGTKAAQLDELMAEMCWVRRLARALVKDDAIADDVAQDAWLVASAHQPSDGRPLRPWLSRVVLNIVRMSRRSGARREAREAATEGEPAPTPAELVERVELQRAVAGEVLELAEPYRSTVLLRFVEGLSSGQIARRLGIPEGTVRRRLKVAIDQLRERLQARSDRPERGWLAALIPFARLPDVGHAAPAALGALAMKKLIAIATLVLVLLAIGVTVYSKRGTHSDEPVAGGPATGRSDLSPLGTGNSQQLSIVPAWIPQTGAPARRIAGHVVAHGVPVGGATVRLALAVNVEILEPIAEVKTAADGSFDFGMQPPAVFTVSAEAAKLTPVSMSIAAADPRKKLDQLVLELADCRSRLFGSVVDASGGGIAKARLGSAGNSGAESDGNGRFSLCVPQSFTQIRVEADGYGTISQPFAVVGELSFDFVLVPEAILVGRVVSEGDKPVAGARVIANPDASEGPHHLSGAWAESDRDGRFRIAGLAPGKFQLSASAERLGMTTPILAIARPTTSSHEILLSLVLVARVRGRVVMHDTPVAGASVLAWVAGTDPRNNQPATIFSMSQPDGSFVLDGVPFGNTTFTAPPYEVHTPKSIAIASATVDGVTLEVGKLATLRGHITRHGKPVAGATVTCTQAPQQVTSDATGAYVIEGLPAGDTRFSAWDVPGKAFVQEKSVALSPGEDKTFDLELDCAGEVKGTVVDESGKPVPGAYVRMEVDDGTGDQCDSMTDADGAFDCASLSGGDYVVAVSPSPAARQAFAPATGDRLDRIHVPRDGVVTGIKLAIKHERLAIRGKVLDDTGAVVADVHIEAIGRGRGSMDFPQAMSNASGQFEIGNLARGSYNLHAHAADGSETEIENIAAGTDDVAITLARPGRIEGTLIGFSTPPIVETNTLTTDLHIGGRAIVEGNTFSQLGLPPGRYTVQAKAGGEVDGQAVDVRSGETTHITLRSRGLGRVEGRITEYGTKVPVAGMRCDGNLSMGGQMGETPPGEALQAFTDARGHFALTAPTGKVRVFCFSPNGGLLSVAGTDIEVTTTAIPSVELVSVRATFGASPGNPGFGLVPLLLPLTVNQIEPGGPAAASGLAVGDHIIAIDGAPVQGILPMGADFLLMNHRPGTQLTIGVERGGATRMIKIVVGAGHL